MLAYSSYAVGEDDWVSLEANQGRGSLGPRPRSLCEVSFALRDNSVPTPIPTHSFQRTTKRYKEGQKHKIYFILRLFISFIDLPFVLLARQLSSLWRNAHETVCPCRSPANPISNRFASYIFDQHFISLLSDLTALGLKLDQREGLLSSYNMKFLTPLASLIFCCCKFFKSKHVTSANLHYSR